MSRIGRKSKSSPTSLRLAVPLTTRRSLLDHWSQSDSRLQQWLQPAARLREEWGKESCVASYRQRPVASHVRWALPVRGLEEYAQFLSSGRQSRGGDRQTVARSRRKAQSGLSDSELSATLPPLLASSHAE